MRNGRCPDVIQKQLHRRAVAKAAILLIESKVGGVKVNDQGRSDASELAQDIGSGSNWRDASSQQSAYHASVMEGRGTIWLGRQLLRHPTPFLLRRIRCRALGRQTVPTNSTA